MPRHAEQHSSGTPRARPASRPYRNWPPLVGGTVASLVRLHPASNDASGRRAGRGCRIGRPRVLGLGPPPLPRLRRLEAVGDKLREKQHRRRLGVPVGRPPARRQSRQRAPRFRPWCTAGRLAAGRLIARCCAPNLRTRRSRRGGWSLLRELRRAEAADHATSSVPKRDNRVDGIATIARRMPGRSCGPSPGVWPRSKTKAAQHNHCTILEERAARSRSASTAQVIQIFWRIA